jgi:hypothetical protein
VLTVATTLLRSDDRRYLDDNFVWEAVVEAGMLCVTLHGYPMAAGLVPTATDLLIRLPPGFPDAGPDMFWCNDVVGRSDGVAIPAVQEMETHLGRTWQRWSRHIGGFWRPGTDDLRSYMRYVQNCIQGAAQ